MLKRINLEIQKLKDTEQLLNLRLLYLYEKVDSLKAQALQSRADRKQAAQYVIKYKIMEKEIPCLEKNWYNVLKHVLALENSLLWTEVYESMKMSADAMKRLNDRMVKLDPNKVASDAEMYLDHYKEITDSLSQWSDGQTELDDVDLDYILNGSKKVSRPAYLDDQEEEMTMPDVPVTPLPTRAPARPSQVKQYA